MDDRGEEREGGIGAGFGVEIESLLSDEQRTVGDVATYVCVVIGMKQKKQETHVGWVCAWIFQIA